jgi:AcrR family transcriptional regulator
MFVVQNDGMIERPPREVVSRRNRPAKAPLSRDVIVSAALDILAQEGLSGLSLRRLATALDTGAASLYVYLANLNELHGLMLDSALAAVNLPETQDGSWRDRLKHVLKAYLRVLYERQGLAQLALSQIASGPNSLRIWEMLLSLLKEGGVDDVKAAWGLDLLTLYVTAIAAEQSIRRASGEDLRRVRTVLSTISAKEFPLVFAARQALAPNADDDQSGWDRGEWALDVIIDGVVGGRDPSVKSSAIKKRSTGRKT